MKRNPFVASGLVVLLLYSCGVMARAEDSRSAGPAPKGWPEQLGKRKLNSCEYGFVYAGKKSAAGAVEKVLAAAMKDAQQDGVTEPRAGLVLVMDVKEKPPFELTKLIEVLSTHNTSTADPKTADTLKSLAEAKEGLEKIGMDANALLSLAPISIEPTVLPDVVGEFPKGAEEQIGWCLIVPTDRSVKAGMKKMISAGMKKEKVGLAERLLVGAMMPMIEKKATQQMKKASQAVVYELLLAGQKDLPEEQKQEKIRAYKQKLGLEDDSNDDGDEQAQNEHVTSEDEEPSGTDQETQE